MLTPFPPKTPMQMRREAEQRGKPASRKAGPVDPADYPTLAAEEPRDVDATADWLAHLAAGRISVR